MSIATWVWTVDVAEDGGVDLHGIRLSVTPLKDFNL